MDKWTDSPPCVEDVMDSNKKGKEKERTGQAEIPATSQSKTVCNLHMNEMGGRRKRNKPQDEMLIDEYFHFILLYCDCGMWSKSSSISLRPKRDRWNRFISHFYRPLKIPTMWRPGAWKVKQQIYKRMRSSSNIPRREKKGDK